MKYTIKTVKSDILMAAAIATSLYFLLSSITYGLLLAMPSIGSLSTVATYFATIGVIGLSCSLAIFAIGLICTPLVYFFIWSPFIIDKQAFEEGLTLLNTLNYTFLLLLWLTFITVASLVGAVLLSVGFSIPFFVSIYAGSPAFITSTFLSLSSVNFAYLSGGIFFVSGILSYSVSNYLNQGQYNDGYTHTMRGSYNPIGQDAISSTEPPLSPSNDYYNRVEDIERPSSPK